MKNLSALIVIVTMGILCFSSFSTVAQQLSSNTARLVVQSYEYQKNEQLDKAIDILKKINTEIEYDKAYVNRMLGSLYWQTENPDKAISHLSLAINSTALSDSDQKDTGRMLADMLMMQGQSSQAEKRYVELLPLYQKVEEFEWLWLRIAQTQYLQNKWAQVEHSIQQQQKYLRLAKLAATAPPLNMLLGAQLAQKKWNAAITTTLSLRELEPQNRQWWDQLIALYMQTENYAMALITLQQKDRADIPLPEDQLKLMAQLYAHSGIPYKAAQTYERVNSLYRSSELLAQQASYWQQAKEWERALASWQKAADMNIEHHWPFALLQVQLKNYHGALSSLDKLPKQTASILLTKAQLFNQLGNNKQALSLATQAHQLDPSGASLSWVKYLQHQGEN